MGLSYEDVCEALRGEKLPCLFVDLDAFDRNLDRHLAMLRPRGTPLRIASKSVRVPALLRRALDRSEGLARGLLCYDVDEAAALAAEGFDDLVVAYPTLLPAHMRTLVKLVRRGTQVNLVVDSAEGVRVLGEAAALAGETVGVVIDVDMALSLLGGRVYLGVRRSPVRTVQDAVDLARRIEKTPGVRLDGVLGYEAQVAGLPDASPFEPRLNRIKKTIRGRSVVDVRRRRNEVVHALRDAGFALRLVNGGGTGSLDSTTPESGVTEVTAGSGLFKPHLFDYYSSPHMRALEPACFFALEAVRRPGPEYVTCLGGGYVASGSVGADKAPRPWLPEGLSLLPAEMAGEVQTPLRLPRGTHVTLGAPVVFRHAKAGEPMERFREVLLLHHARIMERVPTYRGLGWCFL